MTRHSAPFTSEIPRPISILRLQTNALGRLCDSLETAGFLSGPPHKAGNPAKKAYLLDGLQHPKADKLITYSTEEGPQLDLSVFTVKELRSLAACLQIPLKRTDKKAEIIFKIADNIAGTSSAQDKLAVHRPTPTSGKTSQSHQLTSSSSAGRLTASKSRHLSARVVPSAIQHSSDYTTNTCMDFAKAGLDMCALSRCSDLGWASATVLMEPAQPGVPPSESTALAHWKHQPIQQGDMPMPHRNRDPIRSAIRKLFGRQKPTAVLYDTAQSLHEQEATIAALETAYAAPPAQHLQQAQQVQHEQQAQRAQPAHKFRQQPQTQSGAERVTLEQQRQIQEGARRLQADLWASPDMVQFLKEVKQLHSKKKGQTIPEALQILERLQFFPMYIQGYEALADQPSKIVSKGSSEFGGRSGFALLVRGPEQYLTKGPGYIYIYYVKDSPNEFKLGVCKNLPEKRLDSGRLVGRVQTQRKHNNKEYLLYESFPVPHRILVDGVLKVRLKQWNYFHPDQGDGYTEWFRNILVGDLRSHIRDVTRVVEALYM